MSSRLRTAVLIVDLAVAVSALVACASFGTRLTAPKLTVERISAGGMQSAAAMIIQSLPAVGLAHRAGQRSVGGFRWSWRPKASGGPRAAPFAALGRPSLRGRLESTVGRAKPRRDDSDFRYRIFNADGGEVEQCGTGGR